MQRVLTTALGMAGQKSDEMGLYISADSMRTLRTNADKLRDVVARLGLQVALNFDRKGGALIAISPEILQTAVAMRDRGEPVPVVPVEVRRERA
jgi:light-regulated signal transduction histidine kinase (bacteriophytochrome)